MINTYLGGLQVPRPRLSILGPKPGPSSNNSPPSALTTWREAFPYNDSTPEGCHKKGSCEQGTPWGASPHGQTLTFDAQRLI